MRTKNKNVKHAKLQSALDILKWNQSDLAAYSGVNVQKISRICNSYVVPDELEQNSIQAALCEHGVFLDTIECWPADFQVIKTDQKNAKVAQKGIPAYAAYVRATEGGRDVGSELLEQAELGIEASLSKIKAKDLAVFRQFTESDRSLAEVGNCYGITRERVRQIVKKVGEIVKNQIERIDKEDI